MNDTPTQTIADALLLLSLGERNEIGKDAADRLMKLERENAALRADLLIEEERSIYWRDNEGKAMAENSALRADKERLLDILQRWQRMADEWYAEADQYGFGEPNITAGMINDTRAAIDAVSKEEQP